MNINMLKYTIGLPILVLYSIIVILDFIFVEFLLSIFESEPYVKETSILKNCLISVWKKRRT